MIQSVASQVWLPERRVRRYTLDDVASNPRHVDHAEATKIGRNVRIGRGVKLGRASSVGPLDLLSIITSVNCLCFFIADVGVTIDTGVSQIDDQSGNGFHAVQATGSAQPARQVAALGGRNTILHDGTDDRLVIGTLNLPAAGTTPTWALMVGNRVTDATNATLWGGGGSTIMRLFRGSATQVRQNNGANGTLVTMSVATWYRVEALYNNSTSTDYLKVGSSNSGVGTATGNADPAAGAMTIGAQQTAGSNPCNLDWGLYALWDGEPNGTEKTNTDAWIDDYYATLVSL